MQSPDHPLPNDDDDADDQIPLLQDHADPPTTATDFVETDLLRWLRIAQVLAAVLGLMVVAVPATLLLLSLV